MSPHLTDPDATERFTCPRCGAFSHHIRSTLKMDAKSGQSNYARPFNDEKGWFEARGTLIHLLPSAGPMPQWYATLCVSCNSPSVWRGGSLIFPRASTAPQPHVDMPEDAKALYEEARAVLIDSRRASAALARAALEAFLKSRDEQPSRRNLQIRIGELKDQISDSLWQVLTALRIVGNDALHGGEDGLVYLYLSNEDADMAEAFFGALNQLVEELVTVPRRAAELYNMIPEAKREAAERAR